MIALTCYLLIVSALMVGCFFLNGKKLYSPSFLLCLVFFVNAFFALLGNVLYWHEDVSFFGPLIVISGLSLFVIIDYLTQRFFKKTSKNKGKHDGAEEKFYIKKKLPITMVVCFLVGLFGIYLIFKGYLSIAISEGYKPYKLDFLKYVRQGIFNGHTLPPYLSWIAALIEGFGFGCAFFFVYCIFASKNKIKAFFLLLPVANAFFSLLLGSSRIGFLRLASVLLISFLVTVSKRKIRIKPKSVFYFILGLALIFVLIFVVSGISTGKIYGASIINGTLSSVCTYAGSSIVAFDKWFRQVPNLTPSGSFGQYSFSGVYYFLNKFFGVPMPSPVPGWIDFIHLNSGTATNINTMFATYLLEFGFLGCMIVISTLSFFYSLLCCLIDRVHERSFLIYYYGVIVYYLLIGVASAEPTSGFLTANRILYIVFGVFALLLIQLLLFGRRKCFAYQSFRR